MANSVKIGVVGVGHLGNHHAFHLSKIREANLVGVFDVDQAKAVIVAKELKTNAFESLEDLISNVDAVSIVTPTPTHVDVAKMCISDLYCYNR